MSTQDTTTEDGITEEKTESTDEDESRFGSVSSPAGHGAWGLTYAYLYITVLIAVLIGGAWYATRIGLINLEVTVTVNPNLGWVAEILTGGLVVLFLVWTFAQMVRVTGGGFITSVIETVASIADSYELPQSRRGGDEE